MSEITRPQSPSAADKQPVSFRPEELNPDLAAAVMAKDLVNKLPKPSIISKKFAVYHGVWRALNHRAPGTLGPDDTGNLTYYDCSSRLAIYDSVAETSVNIEGKYFNALFAYLMKPKYIIQGMPTQPSGFEDDQPGVLGRFWNRLTGKGQEEKK